jgi:hypothetical protein
VSALYRLAVAGLMALVLTQGSALASERCAFPASPRVIFSEGASGAKGSRLIQVWEVPNAPVYWSLADPADPAYASFRAGVERHVRDADPVTLLRASPGWDNPRIQRNNALVAQRASDWIRPAGCLEKLLLSVQHARVDTFRQPTEFASLVLRSRHNDRLRIYYFTVNEDWIGRMSPLTEPAVADVKLGWKLLVALHNHGFHPGQPSLNGVLAPSEADAAFAANFAAEAGLQAAWITNGLNTSRIPAEAFSLFNEPTVRNHQAEPRKVR